MARLLLLVPVVESGGLKIGPVKTTHPGEAVVVPPEFDVVETAAADAKEVISKYAAEIHEAVKLAPGDLCPTCGRSFPMTSTERSRRRRERLKTKGVV